MMESEIVWVVDDDRSIRWVLDKALQGAGLAVRTFESGEEMLAALRNGEPDALFTDIRMPGIDGLQLLERIRSDYPELPVIVMTAHSDLDSAVSAYQGGAFEYLPKPFDVDEAVDLVKRALARRHESGAGEANGHKAPEIIGESPAMQEVFRAIGRLSRSNITVLINGESGTGKELVALALHRHSPRAANPFIALNMAAIPRDLLESELFGHEKGAFTGAQGLRRGRFEQADGGTLFLDEIGDMPLALQTRLLRVLAEGDYYRVGGRDLLKTDVRVIAATHQDLEQKVREGDFREDLYHRLHVIRIALPPLRERTEDIEMLARRFLLQVAAELGLEEKRLRPGTIRVLQAYDWPGNVRQLLNLCRQLCVMAPGDQIFPEDLPADLFGSREPGPAAANWSESLRQWARMELASGQTDLLGRAQDELERVLIDCALDQTGGQRQKAAELLGLGRNTLTRKLQKFDSEDGDQSSMPSQAAGGT